MSCFSYSNEGNGLYLVYETDAQEQVNTAIVRKLIEKKREGLVKTQYASSEMGNQFKYDINSMITLKQFLQQGILEHCARQAQPPCHMYCQGMQLCSGVYANPLMPVQRSLLWLQRIWP